MFRMEYAQELHRDFWFTLDRHISQDTWNRKLQDHTCYVLLEDNTPIGVLRYNLFWDIVPFLNLIYIQDAHQRKGYGRLALLQWEKDMAAMGHRVVMTSTMVEEGAQHFYRKLGYKDCGCLLKDIPPLVETMEMFLMKGIPPIEASEG